MRRHSHLVIIGFSAQEWEERKNLLAKALNARGERWSFDDYRFDSDSPSVTRLREHLGGKHERIDLIVVGSHAHLGEVHSLLQMSEGWPIKPPVVLFHDLKKPFASRLRRAGFGVFPHELIVETVRAGASKELAMA